MELQFSWRFDGCLPATPSSWAPHTPRQVPPSPACLSFPSLTFLWLHAASACGSLSAPGGILSFSNTTVYLNFLYWQSYALCRSLKAGHCPAVHGQHGSTLPLKWAPTGSLGGSAMHGRFLLHGSLWGIPSSSPSLLPPTASPQTKPPSPGHRSARPCGGATPLLGQCMVLPCAGGAGHG